MPAHCSSSGLYSSTLGMTSSTFRLGFPTSMNATKIILISKPTGQWKLDSPWLCPFFLVILGCGKLTFKIHHHQKHLSFIQWDPGLLSKEPQPTAPQRHSFCGWLEGISLVLDLSVINVSSHTNVNSHKYFMTTFLDSILPTLSRINTLFILYLLPKHISGSWSFVSTVWIMQTL